MNAPELLKSVQFVVGADGQPSAVQIKIEDWELLLDWLEELDDRALVKDMLPQLRLGPHATVALRWQDVRNEWDLSDVPDQP
ncbi:MAG: hypothetical protein HY259_01590 [Chloroflexi bacterium]|nr:hypothetical protein [Chloroflexota bacterium]MBI3732135.1 hypothetical protein [Chloroflexota bacterium]